ncbi:hypothetical protein QBC46DRAFT_258550 [Diplogelasinospora grovesii]|uniref:Uncharacterized protein n=1 Tax=Diplogelasinospora grovesii TaxID=303347 RepID=A0AAN6N9A3_9PEZI|nr:hypothetical protein QBC46DRAFT_258550 [Diplogelasinospora grovesii]
MTSKPSTRPLIKGPLRPPRHSLVSASYTLAPILKNEVHVDKPGGKPQTEYREISLTSLPQPFVNPGDAFTRLKQGTS